MKLAPLLAVATLLATASCAPAPVVPSAGPTSVISVSPAASTPPAATPSATPVPPKVPSTSGAIDVSAYDLSVFSSPSGLIWCGVAGDSALCHFPSSGFKGKVPTSEEICPDEMLDVTGIQIVGNKVEYFCSGDPSAFPDLKNAGSGLEWFNGTGFPTVKKDGFVLATLPYGKKLADGNYVCLSETTGVTCGNAKTGTGFKMAKAGVTFIS